MQIARSQTLHCPPPANQQQLPERSKFLNLAESRLLQNQLISIVGIATGDEGKGRTVLDIKGLLTQLTGEEDPIHMVLKVNGGANSGHTVDGLKHNLIPGGVTDSSIKYLALGRGVVADPRKLNWEAVPLAEHGLHCRLRIDERTMMSDLTDRLLDLANEMYRARLDGVGRGSTGRGISPAFQRETGQDQICYEQFTKAGNLPEFERQMTDRATRCCLTIEHIYKLTPKEWFSLFERLSAAELRANQESIERGFFTKDNFDFGRFCVPSEPFRLNTETLCKAYWEAGRTFAGRICDVGEITLNIIHSGKRIIGEHGQAYWLDKRHGFPPNVTASHTGPAELYESANIPVTYPLHVVGVAKAYETKVGTHVFLTEMEEYHPLGKLLRQIEFGTSTGRQRMVGWFDAVETGHALRRSGFHDLVINKLDALNYRGDWQGNLKICVAYQDPEGHRYHTVPNQDAVRRTLKPVYQECPGWTEDISGVRSFKDLPVEAQKYVASLYVATVLNAHKDHKISVSDMPRLRFIGVGPGPDQIISDVPEPGALFAICNCKIES